MGGAVSGKVGPLKLGGGSESTTIEELAVGWHPPATNSAKIAKALSHLAILGLFQVRIFRSVRQILYAARPALAQAKFANRNLTNPCPVFCFIGLVAQFPARRQENCCSAQLIGPSSLLAPRPPRSQDRQENALSLFVPWRSWLLGVLGAKRSENAQSPCFCRRRALRRSMSWTRSNSSSQSCSVIASSSLSGLSKPVGQAAPSCLRANAR